jgi:hypothetical protein
MFRIHELSQFAAPHDEIAIALPSGELAGAAWTQISDDPFFAEINPAAMGYRHAPKGFALKFA